MAYEVQVETVPAQPAAAVNARVPREAIGEFLGGAFAEVMQALQAQGVFPAGPPFARYAVDEEAFDVTAGFPVSGPIVAAGRVEPTELPGGDRATTLHTGSYEDMPAAFHAVIDWIARNGRQIASDPWESYLDGPEVAQPRTLVCFPLLPLA